jgi:hypothetical protein
MEKRNSLDIIKKEMLETIFIYFFLYLSNKVVMALQRLYILSHMLHFLLEMVPRL